MTNPVTILDVADRRNGNRRHYRHGGLHRAGLGLRHLHVHLPDQGRSGAQSDPATVSVTVPPLLGGRHGTTVYGGVPATIGVTPTTTARLKHRSRVRPRLWHSNRLGLNIVYMASIDAGSRQPEIPVYRMAPGRSVPRPLDDQHRQLPGAGQSVDLNARPAGPDVWTSLGGDDPLRDPEPRRLPDQYRRGAPSGRELESRRVAGGDHGASFDYSPVASTIGQYSFQYSLTRMPQGGPRRARP